MKVNGILVGAIALLSSTSAFAQAAAENMPAGNQAETAPAGQAQATPAADTQGSDGDIVVTARRTNERLQDVPLAVSALTGDGLQDRGITNVTELSSSVPNLNVMTGNATQGAAVFTIRGQSQPLIILTVDNAVGIYQDDIVNPRAYGLTGAGFIDVQRVEVLRGPQGTLYGRNTTGGAVGIFTQDPRDELGGSFELTGGTYHLARATGILNVPISDGAGLRFVASRGVRDGYARSLGPRPQDDPQSDNSTYLRGKFVGRFGDVRISLTADYFRNHQGGQASRIVGLFDNTLFDTNPANDGTNLGGNAVREVALSLGLNPNVPANLVTARQVLSSYINRGRINDVYNDQPLYEDSHGASVALTINWEVSPAITVRSISGYRSLYRASGLDLDGTPFDLQSGLYYTNDRFLSQELQLLGRVGWFSWVAGFYVSDEEGTERTLQHNLFLFSNRTINSVSGDVTSRSWAAFAQGTANITDELRLTAGLRYTREQKRLVNMNFRIPQGCNVAPVLLDTPGVCAATFNDYFEDPSWLLSLDYRIAPDILGYAKVSRGFRGGGQNLRATGTNVALYLPFAPETVTEYELGLKTELFDRRLTFNTAVFLDKYVDAQRSTTLNINGINVNIVTNAASATLWGVEVESRLRLVDGVSLRGSLGYLNASYDTFIDITGDRTTEPFPAPEWNFSIGADVTHDFGSSVLQGSITYTYQTRMSNQPQALLDAQVTQPAFGLLNGRLSLTLPSINSEIAIFGSNLTNTRYRAAFVNLESIGFNTGAAGDPRTVGAQFTVRFGGERR